MFGFIRLTCDEEPVWVRTDAIHLIERTIRQFAPKGEEPLYGSRIYLSSGKVTVRETPEEIITAMGVVTDACLITVDNGVT